MSDDIEGFDAIDAFAQIANVAADTVTDDEIERVTAVVRSVVDPIVADRDAAQQLAIDRITTIKGLHAEVAQLRERVDTLTVELEAVSHRAEHAERGWDACIAGGAEKVAADCKRELAAFRAYAEGLTPGFAKVREVIKGEPEDQPGGSLLDQIVALALRMRRERDESSARVAAAAPTPEAAARPETPPVADPIDPVAPAEPTEAAPVPAEESES